LLLQDDSLMNDFDNDLDVLFDASFPEELVKNHRIATRYVREDIDASVSYLDWFNRKIMFDVKLIDITSKGVLIESEKQLKINQTLVLKLQFKAGKSFVIKAKVVRIAANTNHQFGVKFDKYNNELGDYLYDTQTKLVFK